jgi:hypothetical protein
MQSLKQRQRQQQHSSLHSCEVSQPLMPAAQCHAALGSDYLLTNCHWFATQSQRCHQTLAAGCTPDGWLPRFAAISPLCRFVGKAEPAIVVALYFHTSTMLLSALPLLAFD